MTRVNGNQKKIYSSIYQWFNAKQSCTNPSILSYQRVCEILEHPLKSYIMMSHHWSHARITFQPHIYCYWSLRLSRDNYIFCGIACRKWQVATKLSGLICWLYKPGAKMSWCLFVHHSVCQSISISAIYEILNTCCMRTSNYVFTFPIIPPHWNVPGCHNSLPRETLIFIYIFTYNTVNTIAADGLVIQGVRVS